MNTLAHYFVPQWISVLFLIVIPVPVFLIAFLARKGADEKDKTTTFYTVLGFLALYFSYITICSLAGLFDKVSFPPAVLIYTTVPYAIFLFFIVYNLAIYKKVFQRLQLESLVQLHIFRLIGVFFLLLAFYDSLPKAFAIIAGLGDMLTALSSIFVAKAIRDNKPYAKKMAYVWNTFGLVDILFTAVAANVLTKLSIDTGAMGVDTLAYFPFCFIPAFAPPTIIFIHLAIYKKLQKISS